MVTHKTTDEKYKHKIFFYLIYFFFFSKLKIISGGERCENKRCVFSVYEQTMNQGNNKLNTNKLVNNEPKEKKLDKKIIT